MELAHFKSAWIGRPALFDNMVLAAFCKIDGNDWAREDEASAKGALCATVDTRSRLVFSPDEH